MFFHLGMIVLFLASLLDTPKRSKVIPYGIIGILLLCFVNVAIHSFQLSSIGVLINIFLFYIGLNIVSCHMGEPKQYYKYIAWAVGINCFVWLLQRYLVPGILFPTYNISGGIFGTTPRLFNYLAIVLPIVCSVSPLFFGIVLLSAIGVQHPPIVTAAIVLWSRFKWGFRIILTGAIILFCLYFSGHIFGSIKIRLMSIFPPAISGAFQFPLIGHGLGAYYNAFGSDSFNILILLAYDLGFLGVAMLGYAIWELRKLFRLNVITLSVVSTFVVMMFDHVIEIPRLWFTLMFIIAAFITQKGDDYVSKEY